MLTCRQSAIIALSVLTQQQQQQLVAKAMQRDDGEESEELEEASQTRLGPKDANEAAAWWEHLSKALPAFALAKIHTSLSQGVTLSTDYSGAGFFECCVEDMCQAISAPEPVLHYACDNNPKCRKWLQGRARVPAHIFTDILERVRPRVVAKLTRLQVS